MNHKILGSGFAKRDSGSGFGKWDRDFTNRDGQIGIGILQIGIHKIGIFLGIGSLVLKEFARKLLNWDFFGICQIGIILGCEKWDLNLKLGFGKRDSGSGFGKWDSGLENRDYFWTNGSFSDVLFRRPM